MIGVINTEQSSIKSWVTDLEDGALEQAKNLANLPFLHCHVALMPDCHQGYGMPIGGVIGTKNVIIPNAVGVDIGCGVNAIKTIFKDKIKKDTVKKIMDVIRRVVPVGVGKNHKDPCSEEKMPNLPHSDLVDKLIPDARYQMGTLGSGNHFIELQRDENNNLWIMLHSGSRNLGYKICNHYNAIAEDLNTRYFSEVTPDKELAFLPMDTIEGISYFEDMLYATEFAYRNREKMLYEVISAVQNVIKKYENKEVLIDIDTKINVHHNYAALENHFNKNVYVHRKGAIRARKKEMGIIPGSQGTASFIVIGLGNKDSFQSCSHGAGRKMGRNQARKTLSLVDQKKLLDDQSIIHSVRHEKDLDEAPGAYKDINEVMENQKDLVKVKHTLLPIAVIKG